MPLQRPRDLFALPSPLRTLLFKYIQQHPSTPVAARRFFSTPSLSPLPSDPPAVTRDGIKPLRETLWTSPSISIHRPPQPPNRLTKKKSPPELDTTPNSSSPKHQKQARAFFLDKDPSFAYSASTWRAHALNHYVPEVCILGCSNAGKSTLINALLGTKLARSSAHPGSTRAMNAYETGPVAHRKVVKRIVSSTNHKKRQRQVLDLTRSLVVMDTPGYGYNSIKEWGDQIETYIRRRAMLRGVILLLRSDVELTNFDVEVLRWLGEMGKPVLVMLTRADRCGEDWEAKCLERFAQVKANLPRLPHNRNEVMGEWVPEICVTAAGMKESPFLRKEMAKGPRMALGIKKVADGDQAGLAGARMAVLRLAGLVKDEVDEKGGAQPEPWIGATVSWDELPVKGSSDG